MNTNIEIMLLPKENDLNELYKFNIRPLEENNLYLELALNSNENISDILMNEEHIKKCIKHEVEESINLDGYEDEYSRHLESFLNKPNNYFKDIYDNAKTITIDGDLKDVAKFIENNPSLSNKTIILKRFFDLNETDYIFIKNNLSKYNNILYSVDGNESKINFEDLEKTMIIINSLTEQVKKMDLSPIEQVMYLYDIVRDKVYTKETAEEQSTESRDLTKVLLGKKRVCVGYSNIMSIVLNKLGFKNKIEILNPIKGTRGHARNLVYIEDSKYEIEGLYIFDATWDCKKQENNNDFLYSYRYFANSPEQMIYYENGKYISSDFPCFNELNLFEALELIEQGKLSELDRDMVKTINNLSLLLKGKKSIGPYYKLPDNLQKNIGVEKLCSDEELINDLHLYLNLLNRKLDAEVLLNILFEVRKKEYYSEPTKYPFNIKALKLAVLNSNWLFRSPENTMLESIFGVKISDKIAGSTLNDFEKYSEINDLKRRIEQIRVSRLLREHYEEMKKK